jgi:hypothetical protein
MAHISFEKRYVHIPVKQRGSRPRCRDIGDGHLQVSVDGKDPPAWGGDVHKREVPTGAAQTDGSPKETEDATHSREIRVGRAGRHPRTIVRDKADL